jgi:hypothetical protein
MDQSQIMAAIKFWKQELQESMSKQRREEIEATIARLYKKLTF